MVIETMASCILLVPGVVVTHLSKEKYVTKAEFFIRTLQRGNIVIMIIMNTSRLFS